MCSQMFEDIEQVMHEKSFLWQPDGAKAHTANGTVAWLWENAPDAIEPHQWPFESPDFIGLQNIEVAFVK